MHETSFKEANSGKKSIDLCMIVKDQAWKRNINLRVKNK